MRTEEPRRGIERKILTSILVVGILPMAVVLLAGYVMARVAQVSAVEQRLVDAAKNTAAGIRLALDPYWNRIRELSSHPDLSYQLTRYQEARTFEEQEDAKAEIRVFLQEEAGRAGGRVALSVHDTHGNLLVSTRADDELEPVLKRVMAELEGPRFLRVRGGNEVNRYEATLASPVYEASTGVRLGYLTQTFSTDDLMRRVFGPVLTPMQRKVQPEVYQVVYNSGNHLYVAYMDPGEGGAPPRVTAERLDNRMVLILNDSGRHPERPVPLFRYASAVGGPTDVFLAFYPIFEQGGYYVLVYQPQSSVYGVVNRTALLGILACFLFIAFLCLRAYRNVHNNIVRPVMLLNEGAQIIGQGDLELKLKIGTGDEIEELATSFNKMALALKRNIRRLEESEERYRSLVTSMRDGIYQTDHDGKITFMNPAGVEILGYTQHEEILGHSLRDFFLAEEDYVRLVDDLDERGFVERLRIWMKRRDGRAICVELSANAARDDEGLADGVEGTLRDVTKSVRLEQESRERSERLSAINQIANVINSSLESGRLYESLVVEVRKLVDFDYAALALLDEETGTFQTRQLWPERGDREYRDYRTDGPESCAAWVSQQRQCLLVNDLTTPDSPYAGQFADGIRSCLCVPLYATGRIIGTLNLGSRRRRSFSARDIEVLEQIAPHIAVAIRNANLLDNLQQSLHEVTRAREELHAANEELKTLDEMKTNLLSNVSHELRTPLVSVMGYTDMIYNSKVGPINDTQREYLGISLRNIEKLVTLIENLLDFSRLHRGAEQLVFDTFDLVDCAHGSVQLIKPVADERDITVELVTPPGPILVEGDKGKLGQVFTNLLSNATKFNTAGGKVTVELRPSEDSVEAIVRDTGIGIPPEALDKIFTRFYQYDSSSTRKYGGTGIGLSISQDIVRLHGSRITVSSVVGQGSVFRFTLPLSVAREEESGQPVVEVPLPPTTQMLVELVTQDRALSAEVRSCLTSEGMDVIQAISAEHAVALARKHRPDCVLVDMELGGNGRASGTLEYLLSDSITGRLPIIILTNDDDAYNQYRPRVASRVKRGFRKSSLLSGIGYALNQGKIPSEPLGQRVLCVDDDPEVLTFIHRCLEGEGMDVDRCTSGSEALERAATREYGIVLLDIAMPGMDGWETCRRIKSDATLAGIKVYMVTAKPVDMGAPRTREAGADGFLLKPFRPEDLIELVKGPEARTANKDLS